MKNHIYQNSRIILATKHHKETVIKPHFQEAFGAIIYVPDNYDTDRYGTFSGEISRKDSARETVIKKAKDAAMQYGYDYAIASEGSFGSHPALPFCAADIELMAFIDMKNNIVIMESEITAETNYMQLEITQSSDYQKFLKNAQFPTHALIVRSMNDLSIISKGINDEQLLQDTINDSFSKYETLRLETDMRAMMNPTRMHFIGKLARKLVDKIKNHCPACGIPGFGNISFSGNLVCESCHTETTLYESRIISCVKCSYIEKHPRTDGRKYAAQQFCPYCNP